MQRVLGLAVMPSPRLSLGHWRCCSRAMPQPWSDPHDRCRSSCSARCSWGCPTRGRGTTRSGGGGTRAEAALSRPPPCPAGCRSAAQPPACCPLLRLQLHPQKPTLAQLPKQAAAPPHVRGAAEGWRASQVTWWSGQSLATGWPRQTWHAVVRVMRSAALQTCVEPSSAMQTCHRRQVVAQIRNALQQQQQTLQTVVEACRVRQPMQAPPGQLAG